MLLLSDVTDYTGGHFEVKLGGERGKSSRVALRAGDAVGFPARRLWHRVTKCNSGLRQSIVFWVRYILSMAMFTMAITMGSMGSIVNTVTVVMGPIHHGHVHYRMAITWLLWPCTYAVVTI